MKKTQNDATDLSAQIASDIRDAIVDGRLIVNERLPSEAELADQFSVSRSTVREALKRLAAQSLIRTQRGAFGGAFVNKLSYPDAYGQNITTSTLLLSMNDINIDVACEARFAMERACAPLACARRTETELSVMRRELHIQTSPDLSDEDWCASDVAFHRAFVDCAQNPVLSYQLTGAVEAMQPLMNMITFTARSRAKIISLHASLITSLETQDISLAEDSLSQLADYSIQLAAKVLADRSRKS